MKSNDNIPEDEMLLAEAIAAAKARGLGWTEGAYFRDRGGNGLTRRITLFVAARPPLCF